MISLSDSSIVTGSEPVEQSYNRYPGSRSFHDDAVDQRLFFGRDEEIAVLTHRIRANRLLLLFSKSGLGKTSLLQAGLFPLLRRQYAVLPVTVRFNRIAPPLQAGDMVELIIDRTIEVANGCGVDCEPGKRCSLWEFFKTTDFWQGESLLRPLLVFDQFEEVFTLQSQRFREALAVQLKDLVRHGLPEALRQYRGEGKHPGYTPSPPDLRVILSFREEYVARLEALVADLPALLDHRFRLLPLSRRRAEEAVIQPAAMIDEGLFRARRFTYEPAALRTILNGLSNETGEIDPFQLQVLCSDIERRVIEAQSGVDADVAVKVNESLLGGPKAIAAAVLSRFYHDALKRIRKWSQRRRARRLCELGLLSSNGNRVSVDECSIRRDYRIRPDTLERLIEARLLRKDSRPGLKGYYYELSHDSLTEAILERRLIRRKQVVAAVCAAFVTSIALSWYIVERKVEDVSEKLVVQEIQTSEELRRSTWNVIQLCERLSRNRSTTETLGIGGKGAPTRPDVVIINPGIACRGDISGVGEIAEQPVQALEISKPFALGRYEVTFDEYDEFAKAMCRREPDDEGWGRGRRPVINVSWDDAVAYAKWLSEQTGARYRLPSEAEWEYAARAGTATSRFWGDENWEACRYGNFSDEANDDVLRALDWLKSPCQDHYAETAPVGAEGFTPNAWGLYQMLGNVGEWTQDCWSSNYGGAPVDGSASELLQDDCALRVYRGGSWYDSAKDVRTAKRSRMSGFYRRNSIGFRLAQDLDDYLAEDGVPSEAG